MTFLDAQAMLRECFRTLQPGGWIRVAFPSLDRAFAHWQSRDAHAMRYARRAMARLGADTDKGVAPTTCFGVNAWFYEYGHRFIFDDATMQALLASVGFADVRQCQREASDVPALRGIHGHSRNTVEPEDDAVETSTFEATKRAVAIVPVFGVSVVICTYNRSRLLERALVALTSLRVPAGVAFEIVLIDNNSDDDTATLARRYAHLLPLRYLFVEEQGLSWARNAAIATAKHDLLLWTDDDTQVPPHWLEAYVDAARRHPAFGYFGGPVRSPPEHPPIGTPPRLAKLVRKAQCSLELAPFEHEFGPNDRPIGANMAYRRSAMGGLRFDTNLGRTGSGLIGNEEVAFFQAARGLNVRGAWIPSAVVLHPIEPERQTTAYLARFFFDDGRAHVMIGGWLCRSHLARAPTVLHIVLRLVTVALSVIGYVAGRLRLDALVLYCLLRRRQVEGVRWELQHPTKKHEPTKPTPRTGASEA